MPDQKNVIIAIVLSVLVLATWQYLLTPLLPERLHHEITERQLHSGPEVRVPGRPARDADGTGHNGTSQSPAEARAPERPLSREAALAGSSRVPIETARLRGSIALRGCRLDDLALRKYRQTVDPRSPAVTLLSPSSSSTPLYAEFGWTAPPGQEIGLPGPETVWRQEGSGALGVGHPVTLVWDNGADLTFHRTVSVDERYLFTIKDEVANRGAVPIVLHPYALVSRHGTPPAPSSYLVHEGLIGVLGAAGLQEVTYAKIAGEKRLHFDVTDGWLGITDKYWATALLPDTTAHLQAGFSSGTTGTIRDYQADYLLDPVTIAPGATASANARLFAGPKETDTVDNYNTTLGLNRFDLLIDWGLFHFITKPMFLVLDFFFTLTGNFGVAILIVTLILKGLFFPLANKSYASMAQMRSIQPQIAAIRERWPDDKLRQQQAMMELYRKEKINPLAGCLPILVQVPVFFSLYKVLLITIEMRHAPFFGWIKDLSAPDPTTLFNLFGLIPWDPGNVPSVGHYMMVGAWPIIMGVTMWLQMRMTPTPPDPAQRLIFGWLPVVFTITLARVPAGLVIYWTWNNTLSILQQRAIMSRHGADSALLGQLKAMLAKLRLYLIKRSVDG